MANRELWVSIDAWADSFIGWNRFGWAIDSLVSKDAIQTLVTQGGNDCAIHTDRLGKHEPLPKPRQSGFHEWGREVVKRLLSRSHDVHDSILTSVSPPSPAEWERIEDVLFTPKRGAPRQRLSNYHQ